MNFISKLELSISLFRYCRLWFIDIDITVALGYTILVPANVRFRGVNMQLDLKIDQKTLAAASSISKRLQDAVKARRSIGAVRQEVDAPVVENGNGTVDVDFLDKSAPMSNSLRLKTGGRNPRDILADKLKRVKTKCLNGTLASRSTAPSPSWAKVFFVCLKCSGYIFLNPCNAFLSSSE